MKRVLLFLFLLISFLYVIDASHFRFGTISYQPVGTYNNIKFTSNFAYRISFYGTTFYNNIQIGSTIKVGNLKYGFSNQNVDVVVTVNSFDKNEDWFTGDFSVTKQYPSVTSDTEYYVVFSDCCRISTLVNNKNGNWNITTRVITQPTTAFDSLNQSPVSGMVPIYNVINKRINKFKVVANDPNGDSEKLVFSTNPLYSMTQPSGLTIDSKTGIVTFTPPQTGLFSTQIVVYDAQLSRVHIVVDFLLRSEDKSGFCHESCSNKGSTCKYNTDCKSCTGTDVDGNICTSNVPKFDYPPTTNDGETIYIDIGRKGNFSIQCTTPDTGKTTYIQTANLPTGITLKETIQNSKTSRLSWEWTPTTSNVGSYVVSAVCTDNLGATSTVTSFTISIKKPICGNGVTSGVNKCTCDPGWDESTNCFQCLPGYYGPDCKQAEKCENGAINDGTEGDGSCSCFYGWTGEHCDISTQSFCTPTKPNGVSSYSNSDPSFINPTFSQVYVNTDSSMAATDLGLKMSIPGQLSSLNILVVVDSVPASDIYWRSVSTYMGTFISKVNTLCENAEFGLGFFSDATPGGYNFQLSRVMGDNIDVISSLKYDSVSSSSSKNTVGVLNDASLYPVGWSKGAIRVILVLTDNDRLSTATQASLNTLSSNLVGQSILPIVVSFNADLTYWSSSFSSFGFGYSAKSTVSTTASNDWVNKAYAGLLDVLGKAVVKVYSDPDGFISSITPTLSTNITSNKDTNIDLPIKIKYPSQTVTTTYPEATLSVVGFGTTRVIINYNHPPEATDLYINARQNTAYSITFPGTDLDGNFLNVILVKLPSIDVGQIKLTSSTGSDAVVNYPYDLTKTKFVFVPTTNYYTPTGAIPTFSFKISDGCDDVTKTAFITVTHVNQAPTCTSISYNTILNDPTSFQIKGSDIDAPLNDKLNVIFSDISSISSRGTIKSGSSNIVVGQLYPLSLTSSPEYSASFTFTQSYNPASLTSYSVSYKIRDTAGLEASCLATFNLQHANVAPVITSISPLGINQNGIIVVPFNATDSDSSKVAFTVTKFVTVGGGLFFKCDDENKVSITSLTTESIQLTSGKASYSNLCYQANPTSDTSADSVTFTATDDDKTPATSSPFTININVVGLRDNEPPVAIQIPNFEVKEDDISSEKQIDGTDKDPEDQGKLTAIIKVQPTNGKIVISRDNTAPSSSSAPYKIKYQPNLLFHGKDSFQYAVRDTLGLESTILTTSITVTHVNHAPALSISPFSFKSTDSVKLLTLTPTDVDNDNPTFTCTILSLPKTAKMYTSSNTLISSVPTTLPANNQYYFKSDGKTYNNFDDSFTAKCNDGYISDPKDSNVATGTINFIYVNTAPSAISSTYELAQDDENYSFTVKGNDLETPNNLKVAITVLPTQGTLKLKDGTDVKVSQASYQYYGLSDLTYTPKKGYSDWNMPGNTGPSDQFTFVVYDQTDRSTPAISYFKIAPRNPPTYSGVTNFYVKENEDLSFNIGGSIGGGGNYVYFKLISVTSNGTLYDSVCMGIEGCIVKNPSTPNSVYEDPITNSYNFVFRPVQYENGDNYATVKFMLYDVYGDRKVYSGEYSITINVIPVNQIPVIHLISYITEDGKEVFFDDLNEVNMFVNTTVIIKYDGSDIDNAKSELVSLIPSSPPRGTLYNYNMDTQSQSNIITSVAPYVNISSDGYWYIEFTPAKNAAFDKYARIAISLMDPLNGVSSVQIVINVVNKNVAPVITTDESIFNGTLLTNDEQKLFGLAFVDPDSRQINNNTFTISIVGENDDIVVGVEVAKLFVELNSSCVYSETLASITCIKNNYLLNSTLNTTSVIVYKSGYYRLKLFVDDLGYNAPASTRDQSHLTATAYYNLNVTSQITTTDKDNKTVLTAAIAASAGGAAIIAGAIWQLLRKSAPPTDAFFGDSPFGSDGVSSNPLYEQSANSAVNPLYNEPDMD